METNELKDMTLELKELVSDWKCEQIRKVLDNMKISHNGCGKKSELVDLYLKERMREFKTAEEIYDSVERFWDYVIGDAVRICQKTKKDIADALEKAATNDNAALYMLEHYAGGMAKLLYAKKMWMEITGHLQDCAVKHQKAGVRTIDEALEIMFIGLSEYRDCLMRRVRSGVRSTDRLAMPLEIIRNEAEYEVIFQLERNLKLLKRSKEIHQLDALKAGKNFTLEAILHWFKREDYLAKNSCVDEVRWCKDCGCGLSDENEHMPTEQLHDCSR